MRGLLGLGLVGVLVAGHALASDIPVEVGKLEGQQVTLHVYPFLKEDELKTLRLVATNSQALQVFITGDKAHFSALALAPADGFIKDGQPAETASAIGDLPDAAAAAKAAIAACDAKRNGKGKDCVVVLEVGPAK